MNAKILEAQPFALVAQSDQFSLSKKISDLEKELMDQKATIKRTHEITHFRCVPDKRALNLGNSNFTGIDPCQKDLDWMLFYRVALVGQVRGWHAVS